MGRPALLFVLEVNDLADSKKNKKKRQGGTAAAVWKLAQPSAEGLSLTVWDVRFVKEGALWYLRIFIDKPEGVGIEDCEAMSRAVNGPLDELDPIDGSYCLEVSSPGLGRQLKKDKDFQRSLGEKVECKLYKAVDKQKEFEGILKDFTEETVTLAADSGDVVINRSDIAAIRLAIDF